MCQCKMRFFFPHGDIWTTKWAVCVCGTRGSFFFPDHKMNHEVAEEFHGLRECSSICDLEDYYWSQLGTATALPPRGSANKTHCLGKSLLGGTWPTLRGFYLPQSCRWPLGKKSNHQEQNREGITIFLPKPAPPVFPFSAPSSLQMPKTKTWESFPTSPLPFLSTLPGTHYVSSILIL